MQGLSQDPALSPLPRVDVSSASFNLPIERGFQNFRGETTAVSVRSLMVGQGLCWLQAAKIKRNQSTGREGEDVWSPEEKGDFMGHGATHVC